MNADQLTNTFHAFSVKFGEDPRSREGIEQGCWGYFNPVNQKLSSRSLCKAKFKFGCETGAKLHQRGLIPNGCIPIIVWVPKGETGFWDQFLDTPKFQCLRDEFHQYPGAPTKKYILMGLPGLWRLGDGVIMELIHDSFIPWE